MMRYAVAACALIVSTIVLHAMAAAEPPAAANRVVLNANADRQEIAELKNQIDRMQAELDRLQERLETVEKAHQLRILTVPAPSRRPLVQPIPPDWQRREFNGQEYFIVPLAKEPGANADNTARGQK